MMSELVTTTERVAAERNPRSPRSRSPARVEVAEAGGIVAALPLWGRGPGGDRGGDLCRVRATAEARARAGRGGGRGGRREAAGDRRDGPRGDADAERVLPGSSLPLLETAIYARTTGYLKSRRVNIGDHVKEGDLLAEIAAPEIDAQLEQARATLLLTRANLVRDQAGEELAHTELNRSRHLLARQAVPQQEYDTSLATAKVAAANVKATESSLRVNEATILRLETLQSFQKVTAPFSGIITARNVDPGALVSADSPNTTRELFHLVQIDTLRVFVNVPQVFATDVKVGQEAIVFRREDPRRTFAGKMTRTADALDPSTRTLLTEVEVPNRDMALRPGMYLQVKFIFRRQVSTVLVPAAALATRSDGPRLAVLDRERRVHYRNVQLGAISAARPRSSPDSSPARSSSSTPATTCATG